MILSIESLICKCEIRQMLKLTYFIHFYHYILSFVFEYSILSVSLFWVYVNKYCTKRCRVVHVNNKITKVWVGSWGKTDDAGHGSLWTEDESVLLHFFNALA